MWGLYVNESVEASATDFINEKNPYGANDSQWRMEATWDFEENPREYNNLRWKLNEYPVSFCGRRNVEPHNFRLLSLSK